MNVPAVPMMAATATGAGAPNGGRSASPQRSKGLLPALGVGVAVYLVTGAATMPTVIGAGVGWGVGKWIANRVNKKMLAGGKQGVTFDKLPKSAQEALKKWEEAVKRRITEKQQQLTEEDVAQLWAEFEQIEPASFAELKKVRIKRGSSVGQGQAASASAAAVSTASHAPGQPTIVPVVAADV
mmetsp:Transcript_72573/g.183068  ORF Transcript_72573/g.183068 Transcript_72573/m.183068 type:complete len:183 (+) Transcript_72573:107-655(+)